MKKLMLKVLEDIAPGQPNLASAGCREMIVNLIMAAIKTNNKGWFLDLSTYNGEPKLDDDEKRYKDFWLCGICGKDTSNVEYDYIGSGTNHLGCELEIEMGQKDAKG